MRVMLPDWICLSALIWSSTCCVTVLISTSGLLVDACADARRRPPGTTRKGEATIVFSSQTLLENGFGLNVA